MSMSFGMLLISGLLLLFLTCLALFGRARGRLIDRSTAMNAVSHEKGFNCFEAVTATDHRAALIETANGQFFMVFVSGQHLVVRTLRRRVVEMVDTAAPQTLSFRFKDFTTKQRDLDLGDLQLTRVWREKLRSHLSGVR